jgi:hypothetical protein
MTVLGNKQYKDKSTMGKLQAPNSLPRRHHRSHALVLPVQPVTNGIKKQVAWKNRQDPNADRFLTQIDMSKETF